MSTSSDQSTKAAIQSKIRFLEEKLISLDHYLPETYDYQIRELDLQRRTLTELEVQEHFFKIDNTQFPSNEIPFS